MESIFREHRRAVPPAGYIGGKRNLARRITPIIDGFSHETYVEPFVGMGGIFFRRERRPRGEVINDISVDVTNLFRLLQRHYVQLLDTLKWQLSSRAEFDRLMREDPSTLTDLERAGRFLYLQKMSWGGKVDGRTFGLDVNSPARFDLTKLVPVLEAVHERLAGVLIERLPYGELIRRYDRPSTLFYLDPPYWGCEADYGAGVFDRDDFALLAEQLANSKGRFLLSINDTPDVRETFSAFHIIEVQTTYSIATRATGSGKRVRELLISNLPTDAFAERR